MDKLTLSEYLSEAVSKGHRNIGNRMRLSDSIDTLKRNLTGNGYQEIDSEPDELYKSDVHSGVTLWSVHHSDVRCFYATHSENLGMDIVYIVVPDTGTHSYHVLQVYFFGPGKKNIYSYWYDRMGRSIRSEGMIRLDEFNSEVFSEHVEESISRGKSGNRKYIQMDSKNAIEDFLENSDLEHLDNKYFKGAYGTNQNMIIDRNGPCWTIVDWSEIHSFHGKPPYQVVVSDGKDRVGWLWYDSSGKLDRDLSEWFSGFYGHAKHYTMQQLFGEKALEKIENLLKEITAR